LLKSEFDNLNTNDRTFVVEGYLDGYQAAIDTVESMIIRIGDPLLDREFIRARNSIVSILKSSHSSLANGD
jgi:hypothetical protein